MESGRSGARDEDDPAAEAGPDHDRRGGPCAGRKSRAERMVTLVSARLVSATLTLAALLGSAERIRTLFASSSSSCVTRDRSVASSSTDAATADVLMTSSEALDELDRLLWM